MRKCKIALLIMSILMCLSFSGCGGSDDSSDRKSGKEPTETVNEVTNTAEPTKSQQQPTESQQQPIVPEEEVIIPLYEAAAENKVLSTSPADLVYFETFNSIFPLHQTDQTTANGTPLYQLNTVKSLTISTAPEDGDRKTYNVELFFCHRGGNEAFINVIIDGDANFGMVDFVPVFYNQTKGCLAGYSLEDGNTSFTEVYYRKSNGLGSAVKNPVETEQYGFNPVQNDTIRFFFQPSGSIYETLLNSPEEVYVFTRYQIEFGPFIRTNEVYEGASLVAFSAGNTFVVKEAPSEDTGASHNVSLYFYYVREGAATDFSDHGEKLKVYCEIDGVGQKLTPFIPIGYNETKGCIIGFSSQDEKTFRMAELYWSPSAFELIAIPDDSGKYGFQ